MTINTQTPPANELLVARQSAVICGQRIRAGITRVRADDPIVKGNEHLFGRTGEIAPELERTTSAPGEKRLGTARRKPPPVGRPLPPAGATLVDW